MLEAAEPSAVVADSACGALAGSAGAALCAAGAGDEAGLVNAGRVAETGSGGGCGASFDGGVCTGACDAAIGANVAVSTSSVFAGGAGAGPQEMPSNTSACNAIDTSTHQSRARSSASGCMSSALTADEDMDQG